MSSIKVLQVLSTLNLGGAESRMMDIYRNIDYKICQFDFVILKDDRQYYEDEIRRRGGEIFKLSSPRIAGIVSHIQQLREIIRKGKYKVVHSHTSYHSGLVMFAAYLEGVPIRITHARTAGTNHCDYKTLIMAYIGKFLIKMFSTDRLAVSKEAGLFLFKNLRFKIIPNTIDSDAYLYVNGCKEEACNVLGIPWDKTVIGQVGRLDKMKNHEFTIKWFKQFQQRKKDTILLFIGDGDLRNELEIKVNELGISEHVLFTGRRDDLKVVIHAIDVMIIPSIYEGFPGVVLEAQASGIPIVESDSITSETDLGLGLIERCSLKSQYSEWNKAIIKSINKNRVCLDKIRNAFDKAGFRIDHVVKQIMEIYCREKNMIHK